jgi:hypothetical protein
MKNKSKFIQILVFIALIIAFTLNHYQVYKTCERAHSYKIEGQAKEKDIARCKLYFKNGLISIIELKRNQVEKIPADLIFIFIGGGIIYFTKGKNKKRKE